MLVETFYSPFAVALWLWRSMLLSIDVCLVADFCLTIVWPFNCWPIDNKLNINMALISMIRRLFGGGASDGSDLRVFIVWDFLCIFGPDLIKLFLLISHLFASLVVVVFIFFRRWRFLFCCSSSSSKTWLEPNFMMMCALGKLDGFQFQSFTNSNSSLGDLISSINDSVELWML